MKTTRRTLLATSFVAGAFLAGLAPAAAATRITFYFPVAVGGPVTKIVDGLVAGFEKDHPEAKVEAVYSGSYQAPPPRS